MIKYSCDSPLIGTLAKVGNFSYEEMAIGITADFIRLLKILFIIKF
jgi:hypothetical protein